LVGFYLILRRKKEEVVLTGVSGLFYSQDLLNPGYHFVRGGVGWLVQIDDAIR
jgi:hypothetical protein